MEIYLVGGAVRDGLLGLPVKERDWVVVGGDEAAMLAQGFRRADRDFPVYLHPETGEEYALARREFKTGRGYRGFDVYAGPDVTLEEDLSRRDLTVNAMAQDAQGRIIDPFGGRDDLEAGLLRHVSGAFVEDPLRVLRTARFAARLGRFDFRVAHPTQNLLNQMVEAGGLEELPKERVWREMQDALASERPRRFFEVLRGCGGLQVLMPELDTALGPQPVHGAGAAGDALETLDRIAAQTGDPAERLAALLFAALSSAETGVTLVRGLRGDRRCVSLVQRALAGKPACADFAAGGGLDALDALIGAWRLSDAGDQGGELGSLVRIAGAHWPGAPFAPWLAVALPAANTVSGRALQAQGLGGPELGQALAVARREAMGRALRAAGLLA
jgi:tRNA nucleotidyltransferase (CCA-adding enzyme)